MTEQELRDKLSQGLEDVRPLVKQMTNIIMTAYKKGFTTGLELGLSMIKK